jgi:hypothetical protein
VALQQPRLVLGPCHGATCRAADGCCLLPPGAQVAERLAALNPLGLRRRLLVIDDGSSDAALEQQALALEATWNGQLRAAAGRLRSSVAVPPTAPARRVAPGRRHSRRRLRGAAACLLCGAGTAPDTSGWTVYSPNSAAEQLQAAPGIQRTLTKLWLALECDAWVGQPAGHPVLLL